jgi:hypothetical protein
MYSIPVSPHPYESQMHQFVCPVQVLFLGCLYVVTGMLLYTCAWIFNLMHLSAVFVGRVLVADFILLYGPAVGRYDRRLLDAKESTRTSCPDGDLEQGQSMY